MTYRIISVYVVGDTLTKCKKCIESLSGSKIVSAGQHEAHKQHFRTVSFSGSANADVSKLCKISPSHCSFQESALALITATPLQSASFAVNTENLIKHKRKQLTWRLSCRGLRFIYSLMQNCSLEERIFCLQLWKLCEDFLLHLKLRFLIQYHLISRFSSVFTVSLMLWFLCGSSG